MIIKVYHGSKKIVPFPKRGKGNPANDYGQGFYVTEDFEAAKLWASQGDGPGFVNAYTFDTNNLNKLNLAVSGEKEVLQWITLLVSHRFSYAELQEFSPRIKTLQEHFSLPIGDYDYIEGYRADDNYFAYSRDFVAGTLPFEILQKAMLLGHLGKQIALISTKAFSAIHFEKANSVPVTGTYEKLRQQTSEEYRRLKNEADDSMQYIQDLLRKFAK
jgi:hypothetical protein